MAFGRMHFEVVCGQQLDLLASRRRRRCMHHLKTGSYTVRGPLRLGALLGDASEAQLLALERFGAPLGVAFQLRDDLLGTFGDSGADRQAGRQRPAPGQERTALVAEARAVLDARECAALDWALGNPEAGDDGVARALELLVRSGARERVEARLLALRSQAHTALQDPALVPQGAAMLGQLCDLLIDRTH